MDENEARTLAENLGLKYFETSAFNGQNVSKSVEALLDQVRQHIFIRPLINRVVKVATGSNNFWQDLSLGVPKSLVQQSELPSCPINNGRGQVIH